MMQHLALIMDGNRRWAKKRALMPWLGHKQGIDAVEMVVKYCLERKISYLSLYTFSLENFKRSEQEVSYLFALINQSKDRIADFVKQGVQVRFVGNRSKIPADTLTVCEEIEDATKDQTALQCNFLICYGGQQEIVQAVQKLVASGQDVSEEIFKQALWLGDIPDPDLIIRTGGVKRLSNFLLYQGAYSEIRFLDCLWPDLTEGLLHQTVIDGIQAHKNIGK